MIVLIDGVKYRLRLPENEAELENAIRCNYQHIFGEDSFYFDVKRKIRSRAGIGSIPDGYVFYFDPNPQWCIIEIELSSHSIYDHLIPQLTKFNRGIEESTSRKKLVEIFYSIINEDEVLKAKLKQEIKTGEVYKFLSDLISEKPLIVVAIEQKTEELIEALRDIRGEVKVLEFKIFQREGISDQINAYVFEPLIKTKKKSKEVESETVVELVRTGRGGIGQTIYELFDKKGIENATYEECETLAKKIKPDTKFDYSHFSWYKNQYRKKLNISPDAKRTRGKEYSEEFHTRNIPQEIIELFRSIDKFCRELDPINVQKEFRAKSINYSHGKNMFCSVHLYQSGLRIWLKLKYSNLESPPEYVRDVTNIGHWGVGDIEVAIDSFENIQETKFLIKKSFEENTLK